MKRQFFRNDEGHFLTRSENIKLLLAFLQNNQRSFYDRGNLASSFYSALVKPMKVLFERSGRFGKLIFL